jgi:hypothetical protein
MKRPKLVPISEEMHRLSVMLGEEILRWPQVRTNPMFGMRAYYRGKTVFAILPEKRAFERRDSIMYKLSSSTQKTEGEKWKLFDISGEENLHAALDILGKAYASAKPKRGKK